VEGRRRLDPATAGVQSAAVARIWPPPPEAAPGSDSFSSRTSQPYAPDLARLRRHQHPRVGLDLVDCGGEACQGAPTAYPRRTFLTLATLTLPPYLTKRRTRRPPSSMASSLLGGHRVLLPSFRCSSCPLLSPGYSRAHFLLFLSFLRSALRSAGIHFSCEQRSCVCPCLPLMARSALLFLLLPVSPAPDAIFSTGCHGGWALLLDLHPCFELLLIRWPRALMAFVRWRMCLPSNFLMHSSTMVVPRA
jgi:hypothetical protein